MQSNESSASTRMLSAVIAMSAWTLALISWQVLTNPRHWLNIMELGTAGFNVQVAVLFGIVAPWICLALSLYFDPQKTPV